MLGLAANHFHSGEDAKKLGRTIWAAISLFITAAITGRFRPKVQEFCL